MTVTALKITALFASGIGIALLSGVLFPHVKELTRKAAHIICGTLAIFLPLFDVTHWHILVICGSFSIILGLIRLLKGMKNLFQVGRFSFGVMLMPMGIYLNYLFARGDSFLYLSGIFTLTYADSLASLIGSRVESSVISQFNKSQWGSFSFFSIAFSSIFALGLVFQPGLLLVPYAALAAVFITGVELVSPWGSDNLFIPVGSFFVMTLLFRTPFNWFGVCLSFCMMGVLVYLLRPESRWCRSPWFVR